MKIRIMGTQNEIEAGVNAISTAFDVLEVSDFYPNRGNSILGRVYIEAAPLGTTRDRKAN